MQSLRSLLFILAIVLIALGGGYWLNSMILPPEQASPELQTPKLSMEQLDPGLRSKPLFFTLPAVPYIKEQWQQWSGAFGLPVPLPEEIAVQCDATLQSPADWRALDRKWHFGALLLAGDPAGFRPLLDHLRNSPDWKLTRLDPTSFVFERSPARAWTPADVAKVLAVFQTHSLGEQKSARTSTAHRLVYLGEMEEAQKLLKEALQMDAKYKEAWTELAQLHGMQHHWQEALVTAERALEFDGRYRPAQKVQAHAYYALGQYGKALEVTRVLYEAAPADAPTLMLHAKVAHAAHVYMEEIEILQRMISLLQGYSQPVGAWQIYLGQAYSATGNTFMAADQFKIALKDPTLSEAQRTFSQKALERIELKPDLLDGGPAFPQSSLLDAPEYHP